MFRFRFHPWRPAHDEEKGKKRVRERKRHLVFARNLPRARYNTATSLVWPRPHGGYETTMGFHETYVGRRARLFPPCDIDMHCHWSGYSAARVYTRGFGSRFRAFPAHAQVEALVVSARKLYLAPLDVASAQVVVNMWKMDMYSDQREHRRKRSQNG